MLYPNCTKLGLASSTRINQLKVMSFTVLNLKLVKKKSTNPDFKSHIHKDQASESETPHREINRETNFHILRSPQWRNTLSKRKNGSRANKHCNRQNAEQSWSQLKAQSLCYDYRLCHWWNCHESGRFFPDLSQPSLVRRGGDGLPSQRIGIP